MAKPSEVSRKGTVKDALPGIFQGLSIACFLGSGISAAVVTPKALQLIEDAKREKGEDLTAKETVAAAWKQYIIPVTFAAVGTGLGITSCVMQYNYSTALLAAGIGAEKLLLSNTDALKEKIFELSTYKEKVAEVFGEDKENEISDATEKEMVQRSPQTIPMLPFCNPEGKLLFKDGLTGQFVYSTKLDIKDCIADLNDIRQSGEKVYVDDYCDALGIGKSIIGDFYWPEDRKIDVYFGGGDGNSDIPYFTIKFRAGCTPIGKLK